MRAGDEAGCTVLDELTVETPLVLPERGGVRVQVVLSGPDETGSRTVDVYSLREDSDAWTRHATGLLTGTAAVATGFDFTAWPPSGAQQVDAGELYEDLAERGLAYGPAFQGARAVWRRGSDDNAELFAEVALPEERTLRGSASTRPCWTPPCTRRWRTPRRRVSR